MRGIRIGQIMIEQGILTASQVEHVLAAQKRSGRPFGDLAERLFGVQPGMVEQAWAEQYSDLAEVEDVDLVEIDPACTRLLNRRQAWQIHAIPVHVLDGELVLITDRQHLLRTINFAAASFSQGVYVKVAQTEQLHELLKRVYPVPAHMAEYAIKMRA